MFLHGGHAVVLEPGKGSWALETEDGVVMDGDTVEHIIEAARVLGRYADALAVRSFPREATGPSSARTRILRHFARYCEKPVINLESSRRHPCQGLADALTLREQLGETRGQEVRADVGLAPEGAADGGAGERRHRGGAHGHGRHDRRTGGVRPRSGGCAPRFASWPRSRGGPLTVIDDSGRRIAGADAVYAKSWGPARCTSAAGGGAAVRRSVPGLAAHGRSGWRRRARARASRCTACRCAATSRSTMRCSTARNSVVVDEAENRLHVQRARCLLDDDRDAPPVSIA